MGLQTDPLTLRLEDLPIGELDKLMKIVYSNQRAQQMSFLMQQAFQNPEYLGYRPQ